MKCEQIKDRLTEFADKEMSENEYKAFQAHLDECADCRKELESIQSVLDTCKQWKGIKPSKDWDSELQKKMMKAQRPLEMEVELLRSAIIGLSQRMQKIEERQTSLPPTLEGEIMTIEELARYLRLSVDKVFEMVDRIPRFQIGYEFRFVRESVDRWIMSLQKDTEELDSRWSNWNIEDYEK